MTSSMCVMNVKHAGRTQHMPPNIPKFQVNARELGEVYGCDVAKIQGRQHIVIVDYFSCCIFETQLSNLMSFYVIKALKDVFCHVGSPDKIIDTVHGSISLK